MSKGQSLEHILAQAEEEERKYEWTAAARFYGEALRLAMKTEDFSRAGEIQERIGYCHYRAAFQAETKEEFRRRIGRSAEAYEEAYRHFERSEDSERQARIVACGAKVAYSKSWLAEDSSERKALLDECRKLEKAALKVYEETGDRLGYGKTSNKLLTCLYDRQWLAWDWQERKNIMEEVIEYGEKAIEAFRGSQRS